MNSKKVGFLHIPKTGGVSVRRSISPHWPEGWTPNHETFEKKRKRHPNTLWLGFIRDPLDRAVSTYHFFRQAPDIDFNTPARKGHRLLREMIRFCDGPSHFWENVNVHEMRAVLVHFHLQARWVRGAEIGKEVFLYDFHQFESELDRMCEEHGFKRRQCKRKWHGTKRGSVDDELSATAQTRILEFYKEDLELRQRLGFSPLREA